MRAQFVFQEVWVGLRRNLTMSVALVVVVAISLSLLGTGLLFVKQVNDTRNFWQGRVQLSVYLCTKVSSSPQCTKNGPATAAEMSQLRQELTAMPQVANVTYESQATAYQQFKSEFPSMVNSVSPGDIPDSFEVKLRNTQADAVIDGDGPVRRNAGRRERDAGLAAQIRPARRVGLQRTANKSVSGNGQCGAVHQVRREDAGLVDGAIVGRPVVAGVHLR